MCYRSRWNFKKKTRSHLSNYYVHEKIRRFSLLGTSTTAFHTHTHPRTHTRTHTYTLLYTELHVPLERNQLYEKVKILWYPFPFSFFPSFFLKNDVSNEISSLTFHEGWTDREESRDDANRWHENAVQQHPSRSWRDAATNKGRFAPESRCRLAREGARTGRGSGEARASERESGWRWTSERERERERGILSRLP